MTVVVKLGSSLIVDTAGRVRRSVLAQRAAGLSGSARPAMEHKLAVLKKMVALARSVPDDWSQHEKIGDSPQGWAMHAMVLDIDVGAARGTAV